MHVPLLLFEVERDKRQKKVPYLESDDSVHHAGDVVYHCIDCDNRITQATQECVINERFEHTFANPHGFFFTVGCFREAPGCLCRSESSTEFSWFSGYSWQVVHCAGCDSHLGWRFQQAQHAFWALILNRLKVERGNSPSML